MSIWFTVLVQVCLIVACSIAPLIWVKDREDRVWVVSVGLGFGAVAMLIGWGFGGFAALYGWAS